MRFRPVTHRVVPKRRAVCPKPALFLTAALAGLLATAIAIAIATAGAAQPTTGRPRNLVFMIPDGCGPEAIALARAVAGRPLALDGIRVGHCSTNAVDARITDSAAAATAYACGRKTRNRRIAMDADGRRLPTILEAAEERGMSTGLVVTSRITHATPAAFAAHAANRANENAIALQLSKAGIEVMLGGGREYFEPVTAGGRRKDGLDLLAGARERGVHLIDSRAALAGPFELPAIGLFSGGHMPYEADRDTLAIPSLAEMVRRSLQLLASDPDGFFLLVEGSRIDHAAHANDAATTAGEVLAYDEAVGIVLDFARKDGSTLVISVADHETGGLTLNGPEPRPHGTGATPAVRPEVLRAVRASAARIAERLVSVEAIVPVMRDLAGMDALTAGESERLARAVQRKKRIDTTVAAIVSERAGVTWKTSDHTGVDVDIHAFGPGSDRFRGALENDEVGRRAARALGLVLE